jgi:2-phosphosulfolactate phosphatase
MKIDVVPLPRMLTDEHVRDRVVVVFDVLRATTTIAAALAAGAKEIRVFDSLDAARAAAAAFDDGEKVLCGETKCLPPPGFDLGNSPGQYTPQVVRGRTIFLSTTNGTRALVAARRAELLLAGAIVNARSIAAQLLARWQDVTLLCAGTDGERAPEDILGAGAVIDQLRELQLEHMVRKTNPELAPTTLLSLSDAAREADKMFQSAQQLLVKLLWNTAGGQNVVQAGLKKDIEFAARLNAFNIVPRCDGYTMTIHALR